MHKSISRRVGVTKFALIRHLEPAFSLNLDCYEELYSE